MPFTVVGPRTLLAASLAFARSGLVRPYRLDHLAGAGRGLLRYGAGPAFGPRAGAAFCPRLPGIIDSSGPVPFAELDDRCDRVAAGLAGVLSPGDSVALLARNSAGFYLTMVGAARCGLDVLYLNTGWTGRQVAEAAGRHGARALVHDAEFARRVPPGILSIPLTGDAPLSIERLAAEAPRRPPARPPGPQSRHIILTSGTTGAPKPVPRTGGDIASVIALVSGLPNRARERWLIAAPMFHAWGWLNTLLAMLFTSTIVVTGRFDPQRVLAVTEQQGCQLLVAVPAMLRRIMNLPPAARSRHDTSTLRAVTVSGSSIPPGLAGEFMDSFGDILYGLYGATEAGYATVATPADLRAAPGTAGRPLPLVDVRVLDDHGVPRPAGQTGLIWVASRDTAAPVSLAGEPGAPAGGPGVPGQPPGAVCTGDVGWFDEAGRLFVAGRADDMIITGGENVYPAEVETTLERHPGVLEAAVTGRPHEVYGQVLVAHLALARPGAVTPEALRAWCRRQLAPFQVPQTFVIHDRLPHNAAGKIVKRALRDPA